MKVKWKTKNNLLPTMEAAVRQLNGRKVTVGVSGADNAYLAMIHEYGCKIQVTDKMRAYLHQHGLHLKAGTEYITIPERSFLRNGYDQNRDQVLASARTALDAVMIGTMAPDKYLEMIGILLSSAIKNYAVSLNTPPNHPYTVAQKGSSNPLVDTGDMIESSQHWDWWRLVLDAGMDYNTVFNQMSPLEVAEANAAYDLLLEARRKAAEK